jgi:hypothetical protein
MKGIFNILTIILLLSVLTGCSSYAKGDTPSAETQNRYNMVEDTEVVKAGDFETLEFQCDDVPEYCWDGC